MQVELAYGENGLLIDVPDDAEVVLPHDPRALPNQEAAVREAVRPWLRGLKPPVAVVFPDLTRPFPHQTVLPPLLSELARVGLRRDAVRLLCATGTHRQATDAEMRALLGDEIVDRYPSTTTWQPTWTRMHMSVTSTACRFSSTRLTSTVRRES
jgi:hypothetical protein